MIRRPPRSTRTDTLVPYTTLFRSDVETALAGFASLAGSRILVLLAAEKTDHLSPMQWGNAFVRAGAENGRSRSEEHTSELQSLMRISYAVFCLQKKNQPLK